MNLLPAQLLLEFLKLITQTCRKTTLLTQQVKK